MAWFHPLDYRRRTAVAWWGDRSSPTVPPSRSDVLAEAGSLLPMSSLLRHDACEMELGSPHLSHSDAYVSGEFFDSLLQSAK